VVFYCCLCTSNGGAMHVSCNDIRLNFVCGYSCMSTGTYTQNQFGYLLVKSSGRIEIDQISIVKCPNNTLVNNRYTTILLSNGTQSIKKSNVSNNQLYHIVITIANSRETVFQHSIVSKNYISAIGMIYAHYLEQKHYFSQLNILNNNQGGTNYGLLYYRTKTTLNRYQDCCISGNTNNLFYLSDGTVELLNCLVNHPLGKIAISIGAGNTVMDTNTIVPTIPLVIFSTHDCFSEFSFASTILPASIHSFLFSHSLSMLFFAIYW